MQKCGESNEDVNIHYAQLSVAIIVYMMKLNLFATKLEENHTYIMKNIVKRIAAQDDYVRVNYRIDKYLKCYIRFYRTTVGGTYIASGEISSKGNHTTNTLMRHTLIKVNVFCAPCHLNPSSVRCSSQASGYVSGK